MSANVEQWRPLVQEAVNLTGNIIPVGFALAIIEAESGGKPTATRGEPQLGDASIGLMQLLGATARSMGYGGSIGDKATLTGLYDPRTNIEYGVKHLVNLWNRLGNAADVASAYNGGIRPQYGFGKPFPGPPAYNPTVTVCLARNAAGECIQKQVVHPGEYGNPQYVNKVLAATQLYDRAQELPPVEISSDDQGDAGGPPLGLAVLLLTAIGAATAYLLEGRR